jgi:CheY-like chemotaxis protein/HPt (histidine-containing phosphotransfer) domain-containing protein
LKLFKDYFQANLKTHYYEEGTGLGLSITQNLISLMDGSISVESEFGKGTAFTVEFYQEAAGDETIGDEAAGILSQFRYSNQRRSRNQKLLRVDMSYASVLVVDDVMTNFAVAKGMLKPYKLHVDYVPSGRAAVESIRKEKVRYDAIFMDHMMPGMDGIEAVKIIRSEIGTDYARTVPIIALTANAIVGSDAMFLENGFQAFLSKPIDILRLDQVLNQWVRNKEKEKTLPPPSQETMASKEWVAQDRTEHDNTGGKAERRKRFLETLHIPDLNAAAGLARFENDEEVYVSVLASYAAHAPVYIETVRNFGSDKSIDLDTFRIAVHSLKGSSRSVGAEKLGDMAEKLENAARQQDMAYIASNSGVFAEAGEQILGAIAAYIKDMPKGPDMLKPEKVAPDPETLAKLKHAAENFEMAAVKEAIQTLDEYKYVSQPDLVQWLKKMAGTSDFAAIAKHITDL